MTKAKSHRKPARRRTRVAKTATAAEAIGKLEKGTDTFILTFGQFSLIDAVVAILDQIGPAHVSMSTWTAGIADIEKSFDLLVSAEILTFRMVIGNGFETCQPVRYRRLIELFGPECIRSIRTHAKFVVLKNDDWNVAIRTSMNLNGNPRLENIEVSEDRGLVDFFDDIFDDIFVEVKPLENFGLPELEHIEETTPFLPVQALLIPRRSLNEPETTHVIRRSP